MDKPSNQAAGRLSSANNLNLINSSSSSSSRRINPFSIDYILSATAAAASDANDPNNNLHSLDALSKTRHNIDHAFQLHLQQQQQQQQLSAINGNPLDSAALLEQMNLFNQQRAQLMAAAAAAASMSQQQQPPAPFYPALDYQQLVKMNSSPPINSQLQSQPSPNFLYLMACMFLQQQQQQQQQQILLQQQQQQQQPQPQPQQANLHHHRHSQPPQPRELHQSQHHQKHHQDRQQQHQRQQSRQSQSSLENLANASPLDSLAKLAQFTNQQHELAGNCSAASNNKRSHSQMRLSAGDSPSPEMDLLPDGCANGKKAKLSSAAASTSLKLNHSKSTENALNTSELISSAAQALTAQANNNGTGASNKGTPPKLNPILAQSGALTPTPLNTTLAKAPPELIKKQPAWVFCTRYSDRPSSGPRTRRAKTKHDKKAKDPSKQANQSSQSINNNGINDEKRPRTAFTSEQLDKLRKEFNDNSYLDEKRRKELADRLGLNENQIKIWFQNKRAKMKKQNNQPNPLRGLLVAGGLYNHSTATSDCSESYANGLDQDLGDERGVSVNGDDDDNECIDLNDELNDI